MAGMKVCREDQFIPIARPGLGEAEIDAVTQVMRSGQLAQGERVAAFEAAFASYIGSTFAVATSSGTTALHLALLAQGIGPGDEVITTPFTFAATVAAIVHCGAQPVLADIDPHTLNLSPVAVEAAITSRTRAIIPVHLYGNPCDMAALGALAERHGLALIEDACQAHGAALGGQRVGTFGTGCFSFYPTKNMTAAEGGMVTTSDPQVAERVAVLRNHGMSERYRHEAVGFNYRMSDVHAAIGLVQLGRLDELNARRATNAGFYDAHLGVRRQLVEHEARCVWNQYTLILDPRQRAALASELPRRGVGIGIYYPIPLHHQPAYQSLVRSEGCPVAESACERVLSIPVHPGLTSAERKRVVTAIGGVLAEA